MSDAEDWGAEAEDWEKEAVKLETEKKQKSKKVDDVKSPSSRDPTQAGLEIPAELLEPITDDPAAERRRLEKLQELRDLMLGGNIFGVSEDEVQREFRDAAAGAARQKAADSGPVVVSDWRSQLKLERVQEVEDFMAVVSSKIGESQAKSEVFHRLLLLLLSAAAPKMESVHLKTLSNKALEFSETQKIKNNFRGLNSKKNTDLRPNLRDPFAELDLLYGAKDEDESEPESENDADAWM